MKYVKYMLFVTLALSSAACSNDPTDKTAQIRREALLATDAVGVYCNGEAQVLFDKQNQQLFVDPVNTTFRIQDDQGERYLEVTLSGMPTLNASVTGTIRGTLAAESTDLRRVVLLRSTKDCLWLWSDEGLWGLILPWPGI